MVPTITAGGSDQGTGSRHLMKAAGIVEGKEAGVGGKDGKGYGVARG